MPVNICLPCLADFGTLAATVGQREIPAGGEKSASAPKAETPSDDADGKTSYIERFNCTLRQRLWRLVRKTLSFSQKLENQIGAIWTFIHHYNATQAS
jgi:hypothetical protein